MADEQVVAEVQQTPTGGAPAPETPSRAERPSPPRHETIPDRGARDRRESIRAAREASDVAQTASEKPKAAEPAKAPEKGAGEAEGRVRAPDGKFASPKAADAPAAQEHAPAKAAEAAPDKAPPAKPDFPRAWASGQRRALYDGASPELRAEIAAREAESNAGVEKMRAETQRHTQLATEFDRVTQPYMATMRSMNLNPIAVYQDFLNTAYILNTGTPEQKQKIIRDTAQQYGVDLGSVSAAPEWQDPTLTALKAEIAELRQGFQQGRQSQEQARMGDAERAIDAFAKETDAAGAPLRPHLEAVAEDMTAILPRIREKNPGKSHGEILTMAYDTAVWANADTRKDVLAAQTKAQDDKRKADEGERIAKAKHAAGSISGGPGVATSPVQQGKSRRALISEGMNTHRV